MPLTPRHQSLVSGVVPSFMNESVAKIAKVEPVAAFRTLCEILRIALNGLAGQRYAEKMLTRHLSITTDGAGASSDLSRLGLRPIASSYASNRGDRLSHSWCIFVASCCAASLSRSHVRIAVSLNVQFRPIFAADGSCPRAAIARTVWTGMPSMLATFADTMRSGLDTPLTLASLGLLPHAREATHAL